MKNVFILNKKEGETPLEALEFFRAKHKKYLGVKMTYAGRLDPMAAGVLLVLAGEEVKNKEKRLNFPKEYEFSALFGFATDTYDILGKITKVPQRQGLWGKASLEKKIKENLKFFTGKFPQSYPMYSSRTVKGRPLFAYARAGEAVESPVREVGVKSLKFLKIKKISKKKLLENIERRIDKVKGDFRQKEILKIWRKNLNVQHSVLNKVFFVADFHIKCGSGTYVRGIANSLGEKMGIPALAFAIKRTKIGRWGKG